MRTGVMRVVCLLLLWGGVLGLSDDGVALLAVKRSVTRDPLQVLASWDERDADPCAWCGVTCGPGRRVVALNLPGRLGVSRFQCDGAAVLPPGWSCGVESRRICFRNGTVSDRESGDGEVVPCVLYGTLAREIGNLTELVDLSLPFNGFSGEVPEEIGSLTRLETLDLEANSFSGAVPVEIGQLPRLRVLNLASNAFQGGIPPQATSLCFLSLAGNTLRGSIPPSVGALQWLSLSSNLLDGEIPVFGTCEYLVYLDLSNNYFTGPIPAELANCTQLESLFLNSNSLVGSIPPDFGRLGKLQHLHLALNELSGPLPSALGQCTHLSTLVLSASQGCSYGLNSFVEVHRREGNRFSGGFPSELAVLPSLQVIWGPECGLSGALPAKWGTSLEILNLAKNFFTGGIPGGLGVCKSLVVLDLSENQLSGRIPGELPISCLVILNVSSNALFGSISAAETECTNPWLLSLSGDSFFRPLTCYGVPGLNYVSRRDADVIYVVHDFSSNILSGPVPVSLVGSTLMKKHTAYVLTLANNQLNGSFPDRFFSFCRGFQEFAVNLSYNRLLGELPLEVGECDTMWYLDVAGNQLTGSIPESTGALSHLVILNLARNRLRGGIPWQLGELSHLEGLFLDNNLFSGSMPSSLGNMSSLVMLDLSYNSLSGTIPKELGNLSQLKSLLLNHNRLSGSIPKDLSRLTSLEQLNFSFNNLSGQFPILGNWGGLCSSLVVMGNPYLLPCRVATAPRSAPILADPDRGHDMSPDSNMSPNPRGGDPSPRFNSIVVAAITSGCAIGVVLLVLGLLFQCTKQQYPSLQTGSEGRKVVVTFTNINFHLTYDKLVRATQNFCLDNLIGTGGFGATYKAELRPGLVVAVKRLAIGRFQGVQQFDTEIRTLGRIRHPNLVTLIGYHASEEEMFLIYNYFPEGNLDTLIHINDGGKRMNWGMRYKIALDLARALAYLHDECVPRVLHRDIKPSNVLLDHNLSAHLSDFGLARLLGDTETHATTDVAGTFGYVAPEYAMTCRLSDKADVYSYGVVLLELLSGKRVLDPTFSNYGNGFNIVGWATLLIHNHRPQEVFSAGLWQAGPEKDLLNVLYLAVECTEESMSVRPPMRQVVERLRSCHPHPPPPLPLPL